LKKNAGAAAIYFTFADPVIVDRSTVLTFVAGRDTGKIEGRLKKNTA
jgi:hypothetical protein